MNEYASGKSNKGALLVHLKSAVIDHRPCDSAMRQFELHVGKEWRFLRALVHLSVLEFHLSMTAQRQ